MMTPENISIITSKDGLREACQRLAKDAFVAVDTEFMRETTYWPKLCLIQLAGPSGEFVVDPLAAGGLDEQKEFLQPFFELMANESVLKVFHAGRQDIEIIFHLARLIPHPVFDTQIAAMVCGFGESVGYVALVNKLCRQKIDKSSRFTDWGRRPLSTQQLAYALGDVTHLRHVYRHLRRQLEASGRESWLDEEMAELTDPRNYELHPERAWQRLKMRVKTRKALAILIELAEWRERVAQQQDLPRARVLKDDALYDIANQAPGTVEQLGRLRTINEGFARSARGREVLAAVERGLARDLADVPELKKGQPLNPAAVAVADLLRVLLKSVAARHDVAAKLIATGDDLNKIALDDNANVPALHGWRRELFGEDALALKKGHKALAISGGEVMLIGVPALLPADEPEHQTENDADKDGRGDRQIEPEAVPLYNDVAGQAPKS